ncbi:MAG: hypothetical protein MK213_03495, partial [Planctomycetes bacterium]|nr:hypothetical protein [Planctomycetota bacterium]
AEEVVRSLYQLRRQTGFLPDFLEIGNEPDRPEYWSGTLDDYLEVYAATSGLVRAHFPSIKLGAMGLAGSESTMGGEESALITALKDARNRSLPLDFLSWHHYGQASEIRYTNIVERLRAADVATAGDVGAAPLQLVVSEWNIAPNAWERDGGFDNSHAAANYAAFQEHARQLGLDAACFFMTQDIDDPAGIHDLGGFSVGALTRRGIKKPVWRVMEILGSMAQDAHVPVRLPFDEYGLTATGSLSGDRLRILVANDSVEPSWVFKSGCIEEGLLPGVIQQRLQNSGLTRASNPTVGVLHNAGFDFAEAVSLSNILNRVTEAQRLKKEARTVELHLRGTKNLQVTGVRRFDSTHNAPAIHRNTLIPHLQSVEAAAQNSAATAGDLLLVTLGFPAAGHVPNLSWSIGKLANRYNLPVRVARAWRDTTESMLVRTRIAQLDLLDQVPGASLEPLEYGSEAGVVVQGERVSFQMEPDSVFLLEIDL